ncbi:MULTISPECIES: hypothetical protein [Solirubrobacterales]|uniref:Uncharacterized protein n=1 Tax=Paraconexibacter algicola TaxID=2133960 RepID=A0A2T4UJ83_9ACTN|nr:MULTISPECIES: hypothetical protein [Solirubrobacterales]PTL59296.1 hypothetical protein C7Y72_06340 [Paraconexibacter algicola]
MLEGPIRAVSVLLSLAILVGFALFAIDETREASRETAAAVADRPSVAVDPSPQQERAREAAHGTVRELVDDVNDVALAPFASIVDGSDDRWVRRGVPALLGLLVYGYGLATLARFSRGRA